MHPVMVKMGDLFSINGNFKHHMRLSFAYYEPAKIQDGIENLKSAIKGKGS